MAIFFKDVARNPQHVALSRILILPMFVLNEKLFVIFSLISGLYFTTIFMIFDLYSRLFQSLPFFGIVPAIMDEEGNELEGPCDQGHLVSLEPELD